MILRIFLTFSLLLVLALGTLSLLRGWESDRCTGSGTYTCTKQDGTTYTWSP